MNLRQALRCNISLLQKLLHGKQVLQPHMLPRQVKPRLQSTSYIELRRRRWRDFSAGKHLGDGMLVCLKDLVNGSHDKKIGMTSAKSQIGGVEILHVNGHGIKRSEVLLSFSPSWHFSFISVCKEGQGNR